MLRKRRCSHFRHAGALALLALALAPCPARAQWGMGMGWGWGWGGLGYQAPSPTAFLNQQALTRAAAGRQERPSFSPYANNSNAYFNHIRDNGLVSHYDVQRHRAPSYTTRAYPERERAPARPAPTATAATTMPHPVLPIASFFDASYKLVWPNESPIDGDLKTRRDVSDQASLAVLNEVKKSGAATIGNVTTARQKLLDYGRPALKHVREHTTPRIADTFHLFLLALYDSLAQAATPQTAGRPPAPPVPPAP